jgi:hypothetical protein
MIPYVAIAQLFDLVQPDTLGYGFDDGPNCSHNAFYDFLAQNDQKASVCISIMIAPNRVLISTKPCFTSAAMS